MVIISWTLSFKVPVVDNQGNIPRTNDWLWDNHPILYTLYFICAGILLLLLFLTILTPEMINYDAPISHVHIFLFAVGVVLLASFFIDPNTRRGRVYDSHPLIFHTAVLFLIIAFILGFINTAKRGNF